LKSARQFLTLIIKFGKYFKTQKENHWFGSNGKGIYYLDGNELKLFTTIDGLVNDTIRGIQEDKDGNIYIETPKGISKFDGKNSLH
jgi:ligand-binding sensor domain-containing protein